MRSKANPSRVSGTCSMERWVFDGLWMMSRLLEDDEEEDAPPNKDEMDDVMPLRPPPFALALGFPLPLVDEWPFIVE